RLALGERGERGRGSRKHRAARAIEVAGEHVDEIDAPARERSEFLDTGAEAPVTGRRPGGDELAGDPADHPGGNPAMNRYGLRRELPRDGLNRVEPAHQAVGGAEPHEP